MNEPWLYFANLFYKDTKCKKTQKQPNFALVFIMSNVFVLLFFIFFISPDPGKGFWKARSHAKLLLKVKISIGFGFRLTSSKS